MPAIRLGNWTAGIGDPSPMGWATVCSYYAAALLCLLVAARVGRHGEKDDRTFWVFTFAIMAVLGVCKQFNLPSALTEIGRILADADGWMEQRRMVQAVVMVVTAMCGTFAMAIVWRKIPGAIKKKHRTTIAFLVYIAAFVAFRAISLHGWESVLSYRILGLRVNWIGELTGIFGVCVSVVVYWYGESLRLRKKSDGG
jgi:hypothetical protein